MKTLFLLILFSAYFLTSCDCGYDYSFYIENNTNTDITVISKFISFSPDTTNTDTSIIGAGETKLIRQEQDVFPGGGCPKPTCFHCSDFVEYIHAYKFDTIQDNLSNCNCNRIEFKSTGKNQGDMKIVYTDSDFN